MLSNNDKQLIREYEDSNISEVALHLSKSDFSKDYINFILKQIHGRQVSKAKIPLWYDNDNIIYPVSLSMEQSSSEKTAIYKLTIIGDSTQKLVDLTGGLGVDFFFLAQKVSKSIYIEQKTELCNAAKHNFKELGLNNFEVINCDSNIYLKNTLSFSDVIYLDPSRREKHGRKVFKIEDCTPNLIDIQHDLTDKSDKAIVKFSPMLDISKAIESLDNINEVHIVSVDNECKELIFVLTNKKETETINIYTINIKKDGSLEKLVFDRDRIFKSEATFSDIAEYLYEPNSSILKSGAFNYISELFDIPKLAPNSHLYTSDRLIDKFPGRTFRLIESFAPNKKNINGFVEKYGKANIAIRNYPMSVSELRRVYKIKDGGDLYLFATTLKSNKKIWLLCKKI